MPGVPNWDASPGSLCPFSALAAFQSAFSPEVAKVSYDMTGGGPCPASAREDGLAPGWGHLSPRLLPVPAQSRCQDSLGAQPQPPPVHLATGLPSLLSQVGGLRGLDTGRPQWPGLTHQGARGSGATRRGMRRGQPTLPPSCPCSRAEVGTLGFLLVSVFLALHSPGFRRRRDLNAHASLPRLIRRTPKATAPWLGLSCCCRSS